MKSEMKVSLLRTEGKNACSFTGSTGPGSVEDCAPAGNVKFWFVLP